MGMTANSLQDKCIAEATNLAVDPTGESKSLTIPPVQIDLTEWPLTRDVERIAEVHATHIHCPQHHPQEGREGGME